MREITCCFTGHRIIPQNERKALAERLEERVRQLAGEGIYRFCAGGALGFDTMAALTVLRLREELGLRLILVLPCLRQTRGWPERDAELYEEIKERADETVYVSREYSSGCMHRRNRLLVEESSVCVCCLTRQSGGTAYTVHYACERGLRVINLARAGERRQTQRCEGVYDRGGRGNDERGDKGGGG